MVPIAPWAIFGVVYNEAKGMVPLVYLIGLVAMIFTALSYAQMSQGLPDRRLGLLLRRARPQPARSASSPAGRSCSTTCSSPRCSTSSPPSRWRASSPACPKWAWIVLFLVINTGVNYVGISFTAIVNRIFLAAELLFIVIFARHGHRRHAQGTGGARRSPPSRCSTPRNFTPRPRRARRLVDRGADLPRLRRHRHPQRGGQGRPPVGRASP